MVYSVPKVLSIAGRLGLDLIAALTPHLCDWDAPREPLREAVLSVLTFTITSSNIRTVNQARFYALSCSGKTCADHVS